MKYLRTIQKSQIRGKTFLVRVDLNIEIGGDENLFRLDAIIPTLLFLIKKEAKKIIIISHRGRPSNCDKSLSLDVFAPIISKKTKKPVDFISAYRIGALVKAIKKSDARIILIENIRFFNGEEKNDPSFAKALAKCADIYINDAFAVSHRANASLVAITKYLPSYAGLLIESEIKNLDAIMKKNIHPFTVIIGGAKIADKVKVIRNLFEKTDSFLLGGGPANTFFAARGLPIGSSLFDKEYVDFAKKYLDSKKIHLPIDTVVHKNSILDIGKHTISEYSKIINKSKAIVWNGPMGLFQKKVYSKGTENIWNAILNNKKAIIVVGGGETVASLRLIKGFRNKVLKKSDLFISTGGGATLAYLSGEKLPGIEALKSNR